MFRHCHVRTLVALAIFALFALPHTSAAALPCGTFQQVPTPDPGTANESVSQLAALSDSTAWAIGSQAEAPTVPLLLYFDGTAWLAQPLPAEAEGMHFGASCSTPDGDVWLAGTRTHTVYEVEVIFLRARGGVIDRIDHVFNPRAPIAMSGTSATDVWALTGAGDVIHFDGSEWTATDVPAPFSTLMYARGIYAAGPNDVWAVGYGGNQRGQYIGYAQHWDGSSWTTVSTPFDGQRPTFFRDVDGTAPDDVWVVGYINYSQTIALHWDGSAWTVSPGPPSDAPFLKVAALTPDDVWATPYSLSDYDVIYHWDGSAWNEVDPIEPPVASNVRWGANLSKAGPCDLWTSGSYSIDANNHMVLARLQPGTVADRTILVSDIAVTKLKVTNKMFHGQAVVTIIDTDLGPVAGASVTGTFSGPTGESFTATTGADGKVTFASAVVRRPRDPWCFTVDGVEAGSAVYDAALNVETSGCESSNAKKEREVSLSVTVHPTPFNPSTQFSFALAMAQEVSLEVYDIRGRRVATLAQGVLSAGAHTVTWNASNLPSGVYLYRLKSREEVVTGRVTLLK